MAIRVGGTTTVGTPRMPELTAVSGWVKGAIQTFDMDKERTCRWIELLWMVNGRPGRL